MTEKLPRGLWYEPEKQRFRVRLYKNHVAYLKGYYKTLESAMLALEELKAELRKLPSQRRRNGARHAAPAPASDLVSAVLSLKDRQRSDPFLLTRGSNAQR